MASPVRIGTLFLTVLVAVPLVALAAWNPTTREAAGFANTVGTVRTSIATWTTGTNSALVGRTTKRLLQASDKQLVNALRTYGTAPNWKQVVRALSSVEAAVRILDASKKTARRVTGYQTFVTRSGAALYAQSRVLALSAGTYVARNFGTNRKAVKYLLRVGSITTKAQRLAGATPPRYAKGIRANAKAIAKLGRLL